MPENLRSSQFPDHVQKHGARSGVRNLQAPDDTAQGPLSVVVTNHGAVSASFTAQLQPAAPGLFQWGATDYAVVTRFPDNALIGNPCAVPGTVAAKPGDILTL